MRFVRRLLFAGLALALPAIAAGQSYTISPPPYLLVTDGSGRTVNGGCVWTYLAGTTTAATTYSDNLGTSNTNPIKSDSAGRFTAYLVPGSSYKFVYENIPCTVSPPVHGSTLRTADNIAAMPSSAATVDVTGTAGESITAGQAVYLSDGSGGKTQGFWYKADSANTYSSTLNWVGIATVNVASAGSGTIRIAGSVTGLSSLTVGAVYYVGTSGALTASAPANARKVGQADSPTSLVLTANPSPATGTIGVAQGGTGLTSGTSGGVLGFTASGTIASSIALTQNGVVLGGGAGATPTVTTAGATGQLLAGVTSAAPTFQTASAVGASVVLLRAFSGTDTNASAATVDSIAITGLTANDRIFVVYTVETVTQATATIGIYTVTDAAFLQTGLNLAAGVVDAGFLYLGPRQGSTTNVGAVVRATDSGASAHDELKLTTVTTAWTGSWTLGLRHGGVTAGGTMKYTWAVYKVAGQ